MGQITLLPRVVVSAAALLMVAGCVPQVDDQEEGDSANAAGLTSVPTYVIVNGKRLNVETDYLPAVVSCENPNAPIEAMKAQAVAARTWFAYNTAGATTPTVSNSTKAQVYSCEANSYGRVISQDAVNAVRATRGEVALWNGQITAGFFVAGSERAPDSCRNGNDPTSTEHFVTYNFGYTEQGVRPSSLGNWKNAANRGAMSQKMANCLAETTTYDYKRLLRYFYGSDIQIDQLGASPLSQDAIDFATRIDTVDASCFSSVFYRPAPLNACFQSGANRTWYQCEAGNKWVHVDTDASGFPLGDSVDCTATFSL
jgi:hypothetical protein